MFLTVLKTRFRELSVEERMCISRFSSKCRQCLKIAPYDVLDSLRFLTVSCMRILRQGELQLGSDLWAVAPEPLRVLAEPALKSVIHAGPRLTGDLGSLTKEL